VLLVLAGENVLQWNGRAGWTLQPAGRPFVVEIASVAASGPAARAGLRAGDDVDLRANPFDDRVFLIAAPVARHAIPLAVERNGVRRTVIVVPDPRPTQWDGWIGNLVLLWMAFFGGLIGWRRPGMHEARLLSLALSSYVVAIALQDLVTPSALLDVVFSALNWGGILGAASLAILVAFAALFGRPLSRVRRCIHGLAYLTAALLALYGIAGALALGTAWFDPVTLWFGMWAVGLICAAQVLVLIAGAFAIGASHGNDRQRVSWAFVSIGSLNGIEVVQLILTTVIPTYDVSAVTQACVNVIAVLAPIGLTYSVLSRRLLDIGIALNRAAVFSVVSVILVGTFMIAEWALGNWLASVGHVTSTAFSVALAVALGFSIRFVHDRVDRTVGAVFFDRRLQHQRGHGAASHDAAGATAGHEQLEAKVLSLQDELRAVRDEMRRLAGEQSGTREPVERVKEDA
jgi:MFS family permease